MRFVKDLFENKDIIFHTSDTKTQELIVGLQIEEYLKQEKELLNNGF